MDGQGTDFAQGTDVAQGTGFAPRRAALAVMLLGASALAVPAQAQELRVGVGAEITSIDPHYHNLDPNNAMARHLFDCLVEMDAKARPYPMLAESWKVVDGTTWEFKLRPGVKFHNGSDLTAEDVAFTIPRAMNVPNSPSSLGLYVRQVTGVEVVDPLTVRLKTAEPFPLMPVYMAQLPILDKQTHEGAATEEFNSGKVAIGTGPFKLVRYLAKDRVELERNEAYWGQKPHWAKVTTRMITASSGRTAGLLAGDLDLIENVPTADLERLRGDARVSLSETTSLRLIYLHIDRTKPGGHPLVTDAAGAPLPKNPFEDVRVRRALSMAIDRKGVTERVMERVAIPAGQLIPEGAFGHVPGLAPPAFDAEAARRLLAEAGYPNGFQVTLAGPNNRYVNDERVIQAVGSMWARIGVRTKVEAMPWTTFSTRSNRQEFPVFLVGWGSSTGEASSPLGSLLATFQGGQGASNRGRYSNPELDRLLVLGLATVDDERREQLLMQATRVGIDDVGLIPLHFQVNVWGLRRGLAYEARADERTVAQGVTLAR